LPKAPVLPDRPGWRDYFQLVTTALMVLLGCYILWQTLLVKWAVPPLIFGVVILLFGFYRIKMIRAYFRERRRKDGI